MRIDRLSIHNFRCFEERTFDFSPQFNVVIGDNGSGKTAVLEAAAVAAGSWLFGMTEISSRPIGRTNARLVHRILGERDTFEEQYPVRITAWGQVQGEDITWRRSQTGPEAKTTLGDTAAIGRISKKAEERVRAGEPVTLPVVAYYGAGRLWLPPRKHKHRNSSSQQALSRFQGYTSWIEERASSTEITHWLEMEDRIAYERKSESAVYRVVRAAMRGMVEDATDVRFDNSRLEVVVHFPHRAVQPFRNLSDGQRSMLALVGDLAMRMARLNPQLEENVLKETPGVVLIDELDLHLHPNWQRHVVDDLRRTFPLVQFIATTHSPFIVQTLRDGELLLLEGQPVPHLGNLGIEEIARGVMDVERPEVSPRYKNMVDTAKDYITTLDEATNSPEEKLSAFKHRLAAQIAPFADNPAFQAILELERIGKLGE